MVVACVLNHLQPPRP